MSNAIKFSPNKGTIKLRMNFMSNEQHKLSSTTCNLNKSYCQSYLMSSSTWKLLYSDIWYSLMTTCFSNSTVNIESEKVNNSSIDTLSELNGMLVIEVQDSGAGINAENQSRLFNEIVQFNPEKLQAGGGSGLGLFISKTTIDMHEGRLSIHSEGEGKGTTFRIEISITRKVKTYVQSSIITQKNLHSLNHGESQHHTSTTSGTTAIHNNKAENGKTLDSSLCLYCQHLMYHVVCVMHLYLLPLLLL